MGNGIGWRLVYLWLFPVMGDRETHIDLYHCMIEAYSCNLAGNDRKVCDGGNGIDRGDKTWDGSPEPQFENDQLRFYKQTMPSYSKPEFTGAFVLLSPRFKKIDGN